MGGKHKNILHDFYSFVLILVYWSLGIVVLLLAKQLDKVLGTRFFLCLDKTVRRISGSM